MGYLIDFLMILGSLGLFLYGMKLMSESLQRVAGSKLRNILSSMTSTRFKGVLTGSLVASTIQSSSATTVMVVSFVNAGLLSLAQAISVIMGANIGTTVTAWIINYFGFAKVSVGAAAIPLIGIALPLLFAKQSNRKSLGELILGFAILFLGLTYLKDCFSIEKDTSNPILVFIASLQDYGFMSIILFTLIGTILTIIIQSSSATMAITLVMMHSGMIDFQIGAAMVLGENIGTTVTANLAALVGNTTAKRAARAHFIFNVIGVVWMFMLFYPFTQFIEFIVNSVRTDFSVVIANQAMVDQLIQKYHITDKEILANKELLTSTLHSEYIKETMRYSLSTFHTIFNIINTGVLIWFIKPIEKIVTKMVKASDDDDTFALQYISTGLLSTAEISIIQAKKEIVHLAERIKKMQKIMKKALVETDSKKHNKYLKKIKKSEDITDRLEEEIANYLGKISRDDISDHSSSKVRSMFKIISELESIADVIYHISLTIGTKREKKVAFTQDIVDNLMKMFKLVDNAIETAIENLTQEYEDVELEQASKIEKKINKLRDQLREMHFDDPTNKEYSYQAGIYYVDIFSQCEKIGDHLINITEAICYKHTTEKKLA